MSNFNTNDRKVSAPNRLSGSLPFMSYAKKREFQVCLSAKSIPEFIRIGSIIEFYVSASRKQIGRVVKPQTRRRWLVLDSDGVEMTVPVWKMTFAVAHPPAAIQVGRDLKKLLYICTSKANEVKVSITSTWQTIYQSHGAKGVTVEEFALLIFGMVDPLTAFTAHIILTSNDSHFYKKKSNKQDSSSYFDRYVPKSAQQVSQALKDKEDEQNWSAIRRSFKERSVSHLKPYIRQEEITSLIQSLEAMALEIADEGSADSQYCSNFDSAFQKLDIGQQALICEIMTSLQLPLCPSSAFEVLVAWKVFSRHENITLRRAGLHELWKSGGRLTKLVKEMLSSTIVDSDASKRKDMRHLQSIAIDKNGTRDVDDAISWDRDKRCIHVHIADPTRYFPDGPKNPILTEAMRRGETIHLPYSRLSMFPEELATNLFSLTGRQFDGTALTISFEIQENGRLGSRMSIFPSYISQPRKVSYEKVNHRLRRTGMSKFDESLKVLHRLARKRRIFREAGSTRQVRGLRETNIRVSKIESDYPEIHVEMEEDSEARLLVSELMITANTVAALVAQRLNVCLPYRRLRSSWVPRSVEVGASIGHYIGNAKSSGGPDLSTRPAPHSFLGLSAYTTVTSPIRRYVDIIAHFQIKAASRGADPPFSEAILRRELDTLSVTLAVHRNVEAKTKKYWHFEYLRQLGTDTVRNDINRRPGSKKKEALSIARADFHFTPEVPPGFEPLSHTNTRVKTLNMRTEDDFFSTSRCRSDKRRKREYGDSIDINAFSRALTLTSN